MSAEPRRVAVGSAHRSAGGGRIEILELAPSPAGDSVVRVASAVTTGPIAYLARHPRLPLLYAASEDGSQGVVTAYAWDAEGALEQRSAGRSPGRPSHLCVSSDGAHLLTADYGTSSVSLFRLEADGSIAGRLDELRCEGSGPSARQESSHPHQVVEVDGAFFVPDLGADLVRRITITPGGALRETARLAVPPGSGPRHAVAADGLLYVACELSGEVRWDGFDGAAGFASGIGSSATGADEIMPSAIRLVGDRILVANRGPGTVLDARRTPGGLVDAHEFASGGTWPRDLVVAGDLVVVADHRADAVHVVGGIEPHQLLAVHRVSGPTSVVALAAA
ncbi:beta-propeller fold lactonase family protein [Pseudolysinimonas kribbensis]|uniref:Lactonase family protein n=1 Tax=Pseudolysinimonas kribbensis TaxID=433641 RepID=A0ABQ6K773_9MICO|nr:beta-propeller fold lactonase family protein [Pseudolysinimonas kribbensis]GMA94825.1 hypothetical protein GCM10025881_16490 [Pseudolysinimonas kribbensis]